MRHSIGSKVWVMGIKAHYVDNGKRRVNLHFMAPFPNIVEVDQLTFRELTITEHHKVPGEWDDEPKHDGFHAVDSEGLVWHNQYPRASYGQMDDTADGDFTLGTLNDDYVANYQDKENALELMEDDLLAKGYSMSMYNLCRFLGTFAGGVCTEQGKLKFRDKAHKERIERWKPITDRVIADFHQQTGRKLEFYVYTLDNKKDPNEFFGFLKWRVV